jgi:bifunctional pyridoxal-dependent enzyme with beta-cystathionase and maltose regulon repressor activities
LTENLDLDVDAIIAKVEELRRFDPAWQEHGAVVINNPHNATGRIFHAEAIRKLITYCLQNFIYVIDDHRAVGLDNL